MTWKAEEPCRFGFIGAAFFQGMKDDLLFHFFETNAIIGQDHAELSRLKRRLFGQVGVEKMKMITNNRFFIFQQDHTFDAVAQLAYVSRPRMIHQESLGFGIEASELFPIFIVELLHERMCKRQDILAPLAQRW